MPDNVNPNANSEESARKPGDITTHSINEPGPDSPKPFKVSDEQAYPKVEKPPPPPDDDDDKSHGKTKRK